MKVLYQKLKGIGPHTHMGQILPAFSSQKWNRLEMCNLQERSTFRVLGGGEGDRN